MGMWILLFLLIATYRGWADHEQQKRTVNIPLTYSHSLEKEFHVDTNLPQQVFTRNCGILPLIKHRQRGCGDTAYEENPWQVAILDIKSHKRLFLCSGALLNRYYVVTAANCVYDSQTNVEWLLVRLGDWDLINENCKECYKNLETGVSNVYIHEEFNPQNKAYDVALLKLSTPVDLDQYPQILPICLPDYRALDHGECYVAGWSKSEEKSIGCPDTRYGSGSQSRVLQRVPVTVQEFEWCQKRIIHHGFTLLNQECIIGGHDCDVCKTDTGSPVVCIVKEECTSQSTHGSDSYSGRLKHECRKEKAYILGVVSWSFQCPQKYGYNHRYGRATQKPAVFTDIKKVARFLRNYLDH